MAGHDSYGAVDWRTDKVRPPFEGELDNDLVSLLLRAPSCLGEGA